MFYNQWKLKHIMVEDASSRKRGLIREKIQHKESTCLNKVEH